MGEFRVGADDCIADTCSFNFDYRFQDMMHRSSRRHDYMLWIGA